MGFFDRIFKWFKPASSPASPSTETRSNAQSAVDPAIEVTVKPPDLRTSLNQGDAKQSIVSSPEPINSPVKQPKPKSAAKRLEIEVWGSDKSFVSIRSKRIGGKAFWSPNRCFLLILDDSGIESGGKSKGSWALVVDETDIVSGRTNHPEEGAVADTGHFAFFEVPPGTRDDLRSHLFIYDPSGTRLLKHNFAAILDSIGISPDGRYVIAQTCNAHGSDSSVLSLFDVHGAKLLWRRQNHLWAQQYRFDLDAQTVSLIAKDRPELHYDLGGTLLNPDEAAEVITGHKGFALLNRWEALRGEPLTPDQLAKACRECDEASDELRDYPSHAAKALRYKGEFLEAAGDIPGCISAFEAALALDEKVGIKRKLAILKKASP